MRNSQSPQNNEKSNRSRYLSLINPCRAVQPQVDVAVVVQKGFEHVQHASHLGKNEHAVFASFQMPQQIVQSLKFACSFIIDS